MKKLLAITILLISNHCFSQIKSKIINSQTKEKIQYVNIWVEDENIGTTSNEKGEFELEVDNYKIIHFSAIGFETKKITSDSIKNIIKLKPITTKLNEVVINSNKKTEEKIIGKFKKSKVNLYSSSGTKPWIIARFFEYNEDYKETTFLNKIKVLTKSHIQGSEFNIRLYTINNNGEPEGYIYNQNIIGVAKKGKNITEVDISDLNIEFPEEGFFIAIEWLIIEKNKHEFDYTVLDSKKKQKGISYEPSFGTLPTETDKNSWKYTNAEWNKLKANNSSEYKKYSYSKNYEAKYNLLAIELTLSN